MTDKKCRVKPFVLIIRDGWGWNPNESEWPNDATRIANTPVDDMLRKEYANCLIGTSGESVGLPDDTMGNSEVGHQNMGAGRTVYQESMRLTKMIREGEFFKNETLLNAINHCKKNNSKIHLLGLVSDAGVHSLLGHLYALLQMSKNEGLDRVYLHAFTDGRDTPPQSGKGYIQTVQDKMKELGIGQIASVMGRFWAMDRDQRWDRVEKAFNALRNGKGQKAADAVAAMQASYDTEKTDEFVEPTLITDANGQPKAIIEDGDAVIFFNFRGDRPREITRAFVDPEFKGFDRGQLPKLYYVCLTQYDKTIPAPIAFPKPPKMVNIAGQYWSNLGLKQFRCAETEKYAHVTFFFNDYTEEPFPGEERQIIPSPKVATYDEKPEMSAAEVTDTVLKKLDTNQCDIMVINFANPDMVGHTGIMAAAVKAAETVDACVGKILDKVKQMGGSALITADHGNLERMVDPITGAPFTSHTIFPVPIIVFDQEYKNCQLRQDGILADVVPTALELMEIPIPAEMTGKSLIIK